MSVVELLYDGVDIIADVLIAEASFTALVNGNPGPCTFRVKDPNHTYEFITGKEIILKVDGRNMWGGYSNRARKVYPLSAMDTESPPAVVRYWAIDGVDYNILFSKRIIFKQDDPAGKLSWLYSAATYDDTIINDLFDNYLFLDDDGLTRTGVQRIGHAVLDIPGTAAVDKGMIASAGFTWKEAMDSIARATGGVYYIDPDKDLHYVDAGDVTNDNYLTDTPADGGEGSSGTASLTWRDYPIAEWQANTAYTDDPFTPGNSFVRDPGTNDVYFVQGNGTSGATEPIWDNPVVDNDLVWYLMSQTWESTQEYGPGDIVIPTTGNNGHIYMVEDAVGSAPAGDEPEPTWPTDGGTVFVEWDYDIPPGPDGVGYQGFTLLEDGTALINDMMVWGAGSGSAEYVFSRSTDTDSITLHGLWQASLVTAGLYRQTSADIVSASYVYGTPQSLRGAKDNAQSFSCRIFDPRFRVGEVVYIDNWIYGFHLPLPIRRMAITFVSPTEPIFDIILSNEIDLPIDIYEFAFPPFGGFPRIVFPPIDVEVPTPDDVYCYEANDTFPDGDPVTTTDLGTWTNNGTGPWTTVAFGGQVDFDSNLGSFGNGTAPPTSPGFTNQSVMTFDDQLGQPWVVTSYWTFPAVDIAAGDFAGFAAAMDVSGSLISDTLVAYNQEGLAYGGDPAFARLGYDLSGGSSFQTAGNPASVDVVMSIRCDENDNLWGRIIIDGNDSGEQLLGTRDGGLGTIRFKASAAGGNDSVYLTNLVVVGTQTSGPNQCATTIYDGLVTNGPNTQHFAADGAKTVFEMAFSFSPGSTVVSINGILQRPGIDYVENPAAGTITFSTPPALHDLVQVSYNATGLNLLPVGDVVTLSPSDSESDLETAANNLNYGIIELSDGDYDWQHVDISVDRSTGPLTIRPALGAENHFIGPLTTSGILFMVGDSSMAKFITFDGRPGSIGSTSAMFFEDFELAQSGVFEPRGSDYCTFKYLTFQNIARDLGVPGQAAHKSWGFYISGAGSGNNDHLTIDHCWFKAPAENRGISAIQVASSGSHGNITITKIMEMTAYHYSFFADADVANLFLDDWLMDDCGRVSNASSIRIFSGTDVDGSYGYIRATNSEPLVNAGTGIFTSHGGNSGI